MGAPCALGRCFDERPGFLASSDRRFNPARQVVTDVVIGRAAGGHRWIVHADDGG